MTINAFRPEIWAAELLESLKSALVYGQPTVCNRDYEGEIKQQGDTVRITSISRPTVKPFVKGTPIEREQLTDAQRQLTITQSEYFAFEIHDVDKAQARNGGALMTAAALESAYALADVADRFIGSLYTQVQAANQLGTVSVTTGALAYTQLRRLNVRLNECNVPKANRYVIVPAWFEGLLLDEPKFVEADKAGTTDGLRNGYIGRAVGFDILVSNNTPNPVGDDNVIMAGYPGALSFAEQIAETEAFRPQDGFSDALKGLHVYGAKVLRPDGAATVIASQT